MATIYQIRHAHLQELIARHGGQSAFALKVGVSRQYINAIAPSHGRPGRNIGSNVARKIEVAMGMPAGTMDNEPGQAPPAQVADVLIEPLQAVGHKSQGAPLRSKSIAALRLDKHWLKMNTSASSYEALAIVTMPDDTMAPTFSAGACILVDTAIRTLDADGVYVLAADKTLLVRRVQRQLDGRFAITCDNQKYPAQYIKDIGKAAIVVNGAALIAWQPVKL